MFDVTSDETKRILDEANARAERHVRRTRGRPRIDGLKAWYSVAEFARLAGKTRWEIESWTKGLLRQPGGPGTKRVVYISELIRARPEAYQSLLECARARDAA